MYAHILEFAPTQGKPSTVNPRERIEHELLEMFGPGLAAYFPATVHDHPAIWAGEVFDVLKSAVASGAPPSHFPGLRVNRKRPQASVWQTGEKQSCPRAQEAEQQAHRTRTASGTRRNRQITQSGIRSARTGRLLQAGQKVSATGNCRSPANHYAEKPKVGATAGLPRRGHLGGADTKRATVAIESRRLTTLCHAAPLRRVTPSAYPT